MKALKLIKEHEEMPKDATVLKESVNVVNFNRSKTQAMNKLSSVQKAKE